MHSALNILADIGATSIDTFWLPILAWTALALAAEGVLRTTTVSPRIGLSTRGALVALLPLSLVGPPLLARWVPSVLDAPPVLASPESGPVALATDLLTRSSLTAVPPEASGELAISVPWVHVAIGSVSVVAALAGAIAVLVLGGGLVWIARYRQRLPDADAPLLADAERVAGQLGLSQPVAIATVADDVSPFTVGLWRPMVALPNTLAAESRDLVLAHEFSHVREAHFGWSVAERCVRAAFVWHPVVHVLGRGLTLDRERQADAAVLGLWPERAAEYGRLLHALSASPSPRFALGASSSPLLSRLQTMTHSMPDRRHFARLVGALVLVLPLLASAALLPDASAQAPAPDAPLAAAAPTPIIAPTSPPAPETPDAPLPSADAPEPLAEAPEAPQRASADTLTQYLSRRQVWNRDGDLRVEVQLTDDATYEIAEAIADYYSDGSQQGGLLVTGQGFRIERSTLREDALPPPPPRAPAAPEASRVSAPPPPPTPSTADLARYADALSADLAEAKATMEALSAQDRIERSEQFLRAKVRLDTVEREYQRLIEEQERRRLSEMRRRALGGDDN